MIDGARRLNQHGDRVHYHVNHDPNLSLFEDSSFDFVYSALVLQHMEPRYATSYVEEFARVLAPGGVAMFQLPSEPLTMAELDIEPLAEDAYQARIEPAEQHLDVEPGEVIRLKVAVTNTSEHEWPEGRALRVGNHWRSRRGRMVEMDDGREPLSQALGPGETVELTLLARAPARRGRYVLELDLVQERVTWFADRGSATVPVDVKVRRRLRRAAPTDAPSGCRPVMEIHGVPKATVHDLLASHSMRVVSTEPSERVSGWRDHLYVAVKTAT
jgi:SAM-dependent methyltransferase